MPVLLVVVHALSYSGIFQGGKCPLLFTACLHLTYLSLSWYNYLLKTKELCVVQLCGPFPQRQTVSTELAVCCNVANDAPCVDTRHSPDILTRISRSRSSRPQFHSFVPERPVVKETWLHEHAHTGLSPALPRTRQSLPLQPHACHHETNRKHYWPWGMQNSANFSNASLLYMAHILLFVIVDFSFFSLSLIALFAGQNVV